MTWHTDRIVSLTALAVGIGSLFVVVYQTQLTRQAQYASVRPYLYVGLMANDDGVNLLLNNTGIGPAFIDDIRVRYQGREFVGDPYDFMFSVRSGAPGFGVDRVTPGRLIPAGASIRMLEAGPSRQGTLEELLRLFDVADVPKQWYVGAGAVDNDKAVIEITFSSVYGDRWRMRSDRTVPEAL